ncbi:MAG: universal stress protein [Promethearchaeota archaeon]|jgi:nucleotide-binding universal stress UspA family protein
MYKKILLATDGSKHIDRAASILIGFYKKWGSQILIFHSIKHWIEKVSPPSHGWTVPYASGSYLDQLSTSTSSPVLIKGETFPDVKRLSEFEIEHMGESILAEKKAIFDELQIPVKIRLIIKDYPEDYILKIVEKKKFDLVVVGIKGIHSKISQIFLGSVAEYVVKNAPCDVLVIR